MTDKYEAFTDDDGKPLAKISIGIEETIPTAKYANVKLSAFVTRFVDDNNVVQGLEDIYEEADQVLQKKHDVIMEELESGNE